MRSALLNGAGKVDRGQIQARLTLLLALPIDRLDTQGLRTRLSEIGHLSDAEPHAG